MKVLIMIMFLGSIIVQRCDIFRYCSDIVQFDMISSDIDMICDMSLNEGLDEMGSNISPCSDYIISSNMFKC